MRRDGSIAGILFVVVFLLVAPTPARVTSQQPSLTDVLARAAQYVTAYADPSRVLVCEERNKHTLIRLMVNAAGSLERIPLGGHEWVAELAIIASPDDAKNGYPWLEFRDIISLNKKPVRDGVSRLGALASQPFGVAGPEAMKITKATTSARFGRLDRAVLLPRAACVFLHAANQARFEFKKGGDRTIDGVKTWEVKYQEKGAPTIIGSTSGTDAPCSGSFWIDPATGQVLTSVLKNGDSSALHAELTVTYALDKATGLRLPATLKEKLVDVEESQEGEATGTYKSWRIVPRTGQ